MLCRFIFKNYKSYRDEAVLDMQAADIPEFSDTLFADSKANSAFLPVAVLYGPNGGGKSNVIKAFSALISIVRTPIALLDSSEKSGQLVPYNNAPFIFDELSKKEATFFEVYFREKDYEYRYNISVKESGIESESLSRKIIGENEISVIFERKETEMSFEAGLKIFKNISIKNNMPLLSFLAVTTEYEPVKNAVNWFKSCERINYNTKEWIDNFYSYENENKQLKELFVTVLKVMDVGISDYYSKADDSFLHESVIVKRKYEGIEYEMPLSKESEGTKKLFSFLPQVILALKKGRILVADELDSKLHTKLLKHIVMLFKNPKINVKKAQLIFTSHDLATMRNDVFRRDEIWFAEKNERGISTLYSLYDIRNENDNHINSTEAYNKQYLEGRYGAEPYLENIINWEDN